MSNSFSVWSAVHILWKHPRFHVCACQLKLCPRRVHIYSSYWPSSLQYVHTLIETRHLLEERVWQLARSPHLKCYHVMHSFIHWQPIPKYLLSQTRGFWWWGFFCLYEKLQKTCQCLFGKRRQYFCPPVTCGDFSDWLWLLHPELDLQIGDEGVIMLLFSKNIPHFW